VRSFGRIFRVYVGKNRIDPIFVVVDIRDVITGLKFGDYRFSGLLSAEGQLLAFSRVVLTTLTLPRVCDLST